MTAARTALGAAAAALDHEREVAGRVAGVDPSDPERRKALHALKAELVAARDPLLPRVRGAGRLIGRTTSRDPVRVAHADLVKAIRRVDSRLRPSPGGRRKRLAPAAAAIPASPGRHKRQATEAQRSLLGTLHQAMGTLDATCEEFHTIRRTLGYGDGYAGMSTFREEATELLQRLTEARARIRRRMASYGDVVAAIKSDAASAHAAGRGSAGAIHDTYLEHEERLFELGRRIELYVAASRSLEVQLQRATRRTRPLPRRRDGHPQGAIRRRSEWTGGLALASVDAFRRVHGRLPTKRECNTLPELPPYTTLHREFGDRPLTQLDRLSDVNHKDRETA